MGTRQVRHVLTGNVVVVRPETGFKAMVDALADARVSAVPVVDEDMRVIGVVSEADLLHKVEFGGADVHARLFDRPGRRAAKAKAVGDTARDLMTSPAITIGPEASIGEAARLMESAGVKRLPVVEPDGRLAGIVSRRDLLRVYLRSDAEIERQIINDVLLHTLWIDPVDIDVTVAAGRVTLSGRADRRSTAQIIVRLVRAVDGVVKVVDALTWDRDDTAQLRQHLVFDADLRESRDAADR